MIKFNKFPLVVVLLSMLFISCKKNTDYDKVSHSNDDYLLALEGKKLMETHCYLCHSPNAPQEEGRIAPTMVDIKNHYLEDYTSEKEFTNAIIAFVDNPSHDLAKMKDAVEKYGLMPKQAYPEGSVYKITQFMFHYQVEEPKWFKTYYETTYHREWIQKGKEFVLKNEDKTFEDIGLEYALETKKVLGKNLMGTIQNKGTLEALIFCNHQALPLTDSMSTKFNAIIKRVSDKNRNPSNKANAEELVYIEKFKKDLKSKKAIKPVALDKGKHIQFYYPIETNSMCLQCHGGKNDIDSKVSNQILKLYPRDLAIDYQENELRGIWSIIFPK